jgi:hypothetical protein
LVSTVKLKILAILLPKSLAHGSKLSRATECKDLDIIQQKQDPSQLEKARDKFAVALFVLVLFSFLESKMVTRA